jgi:transcriptional regulator with XRE-family HTH domain
LTQEQAAARARVPVSTLRGWEYGRREPLLSAAGRLAQALGVQVDALLRPADDEPPTQGAAKPIDGQQKSLHAAGQVRIDPGDRRDLSVKLTAPVIPQRPIPEGNLVRLYRMPTGDQRRAAERLGITMAGYTASLPEEEPKRSEAVKWLNNTDLLERRIQA